MFVARQPIYDRELRTFGYELLFRSSRENRAIIEDHESASRQLISDALIEFGLDNLTGPHKAFVNISRGMLSDDSISVLPKNHVVLEILENFELDLEVINQVSELASAGYSIALDDFEIRPGVDELLQVASIVKLDVLALGTEKLSSTIEYLSKFSVKLLAEKVETHQDLEECRRLGCEYFQGYFFCKPKIMEGKRSDANRLAAMELIAKLQDPKVTIDELARVVQRDPSLSYKLIRFMNSSFFGLPNAVESIKQALVLLGENFVRVWCSMLTLSTIPHKPKELIMLTLMRAKMCELLARAQGSNDVEVFFTVGLFSTLDAMMDEPMEGILRRLPLSERVVAAIQTHEGELGSVLRTVLDYETAQWDRISMDGRRDSLLPGAYLESTRWAQHTLSNMGL